jgi:hypothetical protein
VLEFEAVGSYYELLGVWRDASPAEIELAAETLTSRFEDARAQGDPHAAEWLEIVEEARATLSDHERRLEYDRKLAVGESPVETVSEERDAGGVREEIAVPVEVESHLPWRPYLCSFLGVPVVLSVFVLLLAVVAYPSALKDGAVMGESILPTLIAATAVAGVFGLAVLMIGARQLDAAERLDVFEHLEEVNPGEKVDPVSRARLEESVKLIEYTRAAIIATRFSLLFVAAVWIWFVALLIKEGL